MNCHFASLFQTDIKEKGLSKEDFEIGLYNKCLNETYLFDENADKLMVIGNEQKKFADQISNKIQRVLMNQQYLSTDEILIIEDIDRLLYTYSYDTGAFDKLGKVMVHPINPTISYMNGNYYMLYQLWCDLRFSLYECKHLRKENRQGKNRYFSLQLENILYSIRVKEYNKADKLINRLSKIELDDHQNNTLEYLRLQIDIGTGNVSNAKERLKQLMKKENREKAVYQRDYLECVRENEELMQVCSSLCSDDEIKEWNRSVEQEKQVKEQFLKQNKSLKEYYEEKIKNQPRFDFSKL